MRSGKTKKLTTLAMLGAIAYLMMVVLRVPVVAFLKYDPKDIPITIGGFLYGPLAAAAISLVVSFVEMVTVSDTGFIGLVMNILSSCAFACVAALVYKRMQSMRGAVLGLLCGVVTMTSVMLLWNYLVVPLYLDTTREQVAGMLLPVFLPFNLIKAGLNAGFTMLLYKPLVGALRKAGLVPASTSSQGKGKISAGVIGLGAVVVLTCVLIILIWQGVI